MEIECKFIGFKNAKLIKEKKLDIVCDYYYCDQLEMDEPLDDDYFNEPVAKFDDEVLLDDYQYPAPQQWEIIEYLWLNHSIWLYIIRMGNEFYPVIQNKDGVKQEIMYFTESPQEVTEASIEYILNNLI